MKNCPVCRSVLAKTHNQKLLCKICGFVTRSIQVAADNQQFQQRHNFTKKIQQPRTIKNNKASVYQLQKYQQQQNLRSFQLCIKKAITSFIQHQSVKNPILPAKQLIQQVRNIWFDYLKQVKKLGFQTDIMNIFHKINKTRKNKTSFSQKQQQANQKQVSDIEQELDEQKNNYHRFKTDEYEGEERKQLIIDKDQENIEQDEQNRNKSSKKGRKKNHINKASNRNILTFKQQLKKRLKQINKQIRPLREKNQLFAKYLLTVQVQLNYEQILFASKKYVIMLMRSQHEENHQQNPQIIKSFKFAKKTLTQMMHTRKHLFTESHQIFLVILLEDLLKIWHICTLSTQQNVSFFDHHHVRLEELILTYQQSAQSIFNSENNNTKRIPIISMLIKQLMTLINTEKTQKRRKQIATFNLKGNQSQNINKFKQIKLPIPKISFVLVYSIVYLASLACDCTYTIDQIVKACGILELQLNYYDTKSGSILSPTKQYVRNFEKLSNYKIRKYSVILYKFLSFTKFSTVISIKNWVKKYVGICKIEKNIEQINLIAETLYSQHLIKDDSKKLQIYSRIQYLEQDSISKAIIMVYFKLHLGMDNLPYLINFPQQALATIPTQYHDFIKQFLKVQKKTIDILNLIQNLRNHCEDRLKISRQAYPVSSQKSIQNLSSLKLLNIIQSERQHKKPLINLPEPVYLANKKCSKQAISQYFWCPDPKTEQESQLNRAIIAQIELIKAFQQQKNEAKIGQFIQYLDWPADNYQFFYHYTYNARHSGRQIFVYITQKLISSECRESQFYYWLEKIEKTLVPFQN